MAAQENTTVSAPIDLSPQNPDTGAPRAQDQSSEKPQGRQAEQKQAEAARPKPVEADDVLPNPKAPLPTRIAHELLSTAFANDKPERTRDMLTLLSRGLRAMPEGARLTQENKMFAMEYSHMRHEHLASKNPQNVLMVLDLDIAMAQRRVATLELRKQDTSAAQAEFAKAQSARSEFVGKHKDANLPEKNMFVLLGEALFEDQTHAEEIERNPLGVITSEFSGILDAFADTAGKKGAQERMAQIAARLNASGLVPDGRKVTDKDLLATMRVASGKLTRVELVTAFAKFGGAFGLLFFYAMITRAFKDQK